MNAMTHPWPGLAQQIKPTGEQPQHGRSQQYRQNAQQDGYDTEESEPRHIDEYA